MRSARANNASSASCSARDHISHGAQHFRAMRLDHRLDHLHMAGREHEVDAKQRRRLQFDAASPSLARGRENGQRYRRLRSRGCRDACGSRASHVHRRSAGANSMRAATSLAVQCAPRSAVTVASAPPKVPSGWARARQIWPLSRWVCASTKSRQDDAAGERQAAAFPRNPRRPAGTTAAMRPSSTSMSSANKALRVESSPSAPSTRASVGRPAPASWRSNTLGLTSRGSARCRASDAAADRRRRSAPDRSRCRSARSAPAPRTCGGY